MGGFVLHRLVVPGDGNMSFVYESLKGHHVKKKKGKNRVARVITLMVSTRYRPNSCVISLRHHHNHHHNLLSGVVIIVNMHPPVAVKKGGTGIIYRSSRRERENKKFVERIIEREGKKVYIAVVNQEFMKRTDRYYSK